MNRSPESRYIWFEHPRSANGWRERYLEANADKAFQVDGLEEVLGRDPAQIAVAGRGSSMHELKAELAEYGDRIGVILSRSTLVGRLLVHGNRTGRRVEGEGPRFPR